MTTFTFTDGPALEESDARWRSRSAYRADLCGRLERALAGAEREVKGGVMDGLRVVTHSMVSAAIALVGREPLPEIDYHAAEILTGATLTVWAVCPRCKIAGPVTMTVDTILEQDAVSSVLKLKAAAKKRTHVCGQLTVPEPAPVHGQTRAFADEDAGDPEEPEAIEMPGPAELLQLEPGDIVDAEAVEIADEPLWDDDLPKCRLCGCSDAFACEGGCSWVEDPEQLGELCSACLATFDQPEAPAPDPALKLGPVSWSTGDDDTLPGERFDLGSCPFPGCDLAAEHPGAHQVAEPEVPKCGFEGCDLPEHTGRHRKPRKGGAS